jgi:SAM-dependent methyltransferase
MVEEYEKRRIRRIRGLRKKYENYKFKISSPLLDIGGGDGFFLESQKIEYSDILGFTEFKNKNYHYISSDLTKKLPKFNKKYKTIFIMEVLEHLRNPLYLLAQVYDLLEEKGVCYISIPYTNLNTGEHASGNWEKGHVCRWKKKEILDQLFKLGFKPRVIQQRRRFKNTAFWLPYCWLVLELRK